MRALRFHHFGEPADVLRLDHLLRPDPAPGQVRVRLTHRSINPADLATVRGRYGRLPALPAVGGHEGTGVVEALGDGVDPALGGARVVVLGTAPTWQEAVVVDAADVLPVPEALPDEAAAQLFVNPLTAYLLLEAAGAAPGDWLVQSAGASAVARIVTAMARARGLRVVSVVRDDTHRAALEALGAAVVVADGRSAEAREAIAAHTGPEGARAALDAVAGETGSLLLGALGEGGVHLVYGALSGRPLPVAPRHLLYRRLTVRGVWRTRWFAETARAESRPVLERLAADAARGAFPLPVAATFDLADGAEAVRAAEARGRFGKVLLTG
ncbi:MAG: zinc-dependent alcohol dehydrogenase family protein [Rubricoccaceae bacterium]